jgi:hypothetical protein
MRNPYLWQETGIEEAGILKRILIKHVPKKTVTSKAGHSSSIGIRRQGKPSRQRPNALADLVDQGV